MFIKCTYYVSTSILSALYTFYPFVRTPPFNPHNNPMWSQLFLCIDGENETERCPVVPKDTQLVICNSQNNPS